MYVCMYCMYICVPIYYLNSSHKPIPTYAYSYGFLYLVLFCIFRRFGGVRLEDVVLVTEDGVDNLTTCPRTVEEVENTFS
jgi:Xaa-Pro dipeptidase